MGEGDDIVAQLALDDAAFWVTAADPDRQRLSPPAAGGATCRVLLVPEDPDALLARAVGTSATAISPVDDEHGWRVGRIIDLFGSEWEIARPLSAWPPARVSSPAGTRSYMLDRH
jgi:PhnB protein